MADQRWRDRPAVMTDETVALLADRLGGYAQATGLRGLSVVLHGGEPLLAGTRMIGRTVAAIRTALPDTKVRVTMQTNGTILTSKTLDALRTSGITVGVSLDGGGAANDAHRRTARGRGSYARIVSGLKLLSGPYTDLYAGLLCTVDTTSDPVATYEELLSHAPPRIDFLLPHATWEQPPPPDGRHGRWLIAAFDRWWTAPRQETSIRLFESIVDLMLGGRSELGTLGQDRAPLLTVETDGSMEGDDGMKATALENVETGLHLRTHTIADALAHPSVALWRTPIAPSCTTCPVVSVCGGGHVAHRYSRENGFANPSAYCTDLRLLIEHIRAAVEATIRSREAAQC